MSVEGVSPAALSRLWTDGSLVKLTTCVILLGRSPTPSKTTVASSVDSFAPTTVAPVVPSPNSFPLSSQSRPKLSLLSRSPNYDVTNLEDPDPLAVKKLAGSLHASPFARFTGASTRLLDHPFSLDGLPVLSDTPLLSPRGPSSVDTRASSNSSMKVQNEQQNGTGFFHPESVELSAKDAKEEYWRERVRREKAVSETLLIAAHYLGRAKENMEQHIDALKPLLACPVGEVEEHEAGTVGTATKLLRRIAESWGELAPVLPSTRLSDYLSSRCDASKAQEKEAAFLAARLLDLIEELYLLLSGERATEEEEAVRLEKLCRVLGEPVEKVQRVRSLMGASAAELLRENPAQLEEALQSLERVVPCTESLLKALKADFVDWWTLYSISNSACEVSGTAYTTPVAVHGTEESVGSAVLVSFSPSVQGVPSSVVLIPAAILAISMGNSPYIQLRYQLGSAMCTSDEYLTSVKVDKTRSDGNAWVDGCLVMESGRNKEISQVVQRGAKFESVEKIGAKRPSQEPSDFVETKRCLNSGDHDPNSSHFPQESDLLLSVGESCADAKEEKNESPWFNASTATSFLSLRSNTSSKQTVHSPPTNQFLVNLLENNSPTLPKLSIPFPAAGSSSLSSDDQLQRHKNASSPLRDRHPNAKRSLSLLNDTPSNSFSSTLVGNKRDARGVLRLNHTLPPHTTPDCRPEESVHDMSLGESMQNKFNTGSGESSECLRTPGTTLPPSGSFNACTLPPDHLSFPQSSHPSFTEKQQNAALPNSSLGQAMYSTPIESRNPLSEADGRTEFVKIESMNVTATQMLGGSTYEELSRLRFFAPVNEKEVAGRDVAGLVEWYHRLREGLQSLPRSDSEPITTASAVEWLCGQMGLHEVAPIGPEGSGQAGEDLLAAVSRCAATPESPAHLVVLDTATGAFHGVDAYRWEDSRSTQLCVSLVFRYVLCGSSHPFTAACSFEANSRSGDVNPSSSPFSLSAKCNEVKAHDGVPFPSLLSSHESEGTVSKGSSSFTLRDPDSVPSEGSSSDRRRTPHRVAVNVLLPSQPCEASGEHFIKSTEPVNKPIKLSEDGNSAMVGLKGLLRSGKSGKISCISVHQFSSSGVSSHSIAPELPKASGSFHQDASLSESDPVRIGKRQEEPHEVQENRAESAETDFTGGSRSVLHSGRGSDNSKLQSSQTASAKEGLQIHKVDHNFFYSRKSDINEINMDRVKQLFLHGGSSLVMAEKYLPSRLMLNDILLAITVQRVQQHLWRQHASLAKSLSSEGTSIPPAAPLAVFIHQCEMHLVIDLVPLEKVPSGEVEREAYRIKIEEYYRERQKEHQQLFVGVIPAFYATQKEMAQSLFNHTWAKSVIDRSWVKQPREEINLTPTFPCFLHGGSEREGSQGVPLSREPSLGLAECRSMPSFSAGPFLQNGDSANGATRALPASSHEVFPLPDVWAFHAIDVKTERRMVYPGRYLGEELQDVLKSLHAAVVVTTGGTATITFPFITQYRLDLLKEMNLINHVHTALAEMGIVGINQLTHQIVELKEAVKREESHHQPIVSLNVGNSLRNKFKRLARKAICLPALETLETTTIPKDDSTAFSTSSFTSRLPCSQPTSMDEPSSIIATVSHSINPSSSSSSPLTATPTVDSTPKGSVVITSSLQKEKASSWKNNEDIEKLIATERTVMNLPSSLSLSITSKSTFSGSQRGFPFSVPPQFPFSNKVSVPGKVLPEKQFNGLSCTISDEKTSIAGSDDTCSSSTTLEKRTGRFSRISFAPAEAESLPESLYQYSPSSSSMNNSSLNPSSSFSSRFTGDRSHLSEGSRFDLRQYFSLSQTSNFNFLDLCTLPNKGKNVHRVDSPFFRCLFFCTSPSVALFEWLISVGHSVAIATSHLQMMNLIRCDVTGFDIVVIEWNFRTVTKEVYRLLEECVYSNPFRCIPIFYCVVGKEYEQCVASGIFPTKTERASEEEGLSDDDWRGKASWCPDFPTGSFQQASDLDPSAPSQSLNLCPPFPSNADPSHVLCGTDMADAILPYRTRVRDFVRLGRILKDLRGNPWSKLSYTIVCRIAEGKKSEVFEVVMGASQGTLAMKQIAIGTVDVERIDYLYKEVAIMREIDHRNLIQFSHVMCDEEYLRIFMELCEITVNDVLPNAHIFPRTALENSQVSNEALHAGVTFLSGFSQASWVLPELHHSGRSSGDAQTPSSQETRANPKSSKDEYNVSALQTHQMFFYVAGYGKQSNFNDKDSDGTARGSGKERKLIEPMLLVRDILSAVKYLHSFDILHRDICSKNVFISDGVAKLGDYGSAGTCSSTNDHPRSSSYMPPENFNREPFLKPGDVWSLGMLLAEILGIRFAHSTLLPLPVLEQYYNSLHQDDIVPVVATNAPLDFVGQQYLPKELHAAVLEVMKEASDCAKKESGSSQEGVNSEPRRTTSCPSVSPSVGLSQSPLACNGALQMRTIYVVEVDSKSMKVKTSHHQLPAALIELLESTLHRTPEKRISTEQLLEHPIANDREWVQQMLAEVRYLNRRVGNHLSLDVNVRTESSNSLGFHGNSQEDAW